MLHTSCYISHEPCLNCVDQDCSADASNRYGSPAGVPHGLGVWSWSGVSSRGTAMVWYGRVGSGRVGLVLRLQVGSRSEVAVGLALEGASNSTDLVQIATLTQLDLTPITLHTAPVILSPCLDLGRNISYPDPWLDRGRRLSLSLSLMSMPLPCVALAVRCGPSASDRPRMPHTSL